jgi:hypothetical protein
VSAQAGSSAGVTELSVSLARKCRSVPPSRRTGLCSHPVRF